MDFPGLALLDACKYYDYIHQRYYQHRKPVVKVHSPLW